MEAAVGEDERGPFLTLRVEGGAVCLACEEGWEVVLAREGEGFRVGVVGGEIGLGLGCGWCERGSEGIDRGGERGG